MRGDCQIGYFSWVSLGLGWRRAVAARPFMHLSLGRWPRHEQRNLGIHQIQLDIRRGRWGSRTRLKNPVGAVPRRGSLASIQIAEQAFRLHQALSARNLAS